MPKYINADKFVIPKGTVDDIAKRGVNAIHDLLEIQPSADVVEVVRCEDCKYCTGEGDWCQNEKVRSMCCADGMVEHYFGDNHTAFYPYMDFFCKYGERKEETDGEDTNTI